MRVCSARHSSGAPWLKNKNKIHFLTHFSSRAPPLLCVLSLQLFWPHAVFYSDSCIPPLVPRMSRLQPQAPQNKRKRSTGTLLRPSGSPVAPRHSHNPAYGIRYVAQLDKLLAAGLPPSLNVPALVFSWGFFPSVFVQYPIWSGGKLGVKNGRCFSSGATGAGNCSLSLSPDCRRITAIAVLANVRLTMNAR